MSAGKLWWRIGGSVLTVGVLAMALLNLLGLLAFHRDPVELEFDAEHLTTLDVGIESGRLEIVGVESPTVRVEGTVTSGLVGTRHSERVVDDRLLLRSSCPGGPASSWCEVDYRVEVPADLTVRVDADNSRVEVRDLRGVVDVRTSNNRIEAESLTGDVSLTTSNDDVVATGLASSRARITSSNARVRAEFTESPDQVDIRSSNDDVDVVLPDTPDAYSVDVSTSNGNQRVDVRTDPTSERTVVVDTSNGDVRVVYPAS
ncbi:MAG: DUF4097 family beta strand repeat-containing protein [Microthrixaceae bacterium]